MVDEIQNFQASQLELGLLILCLISHVLIRVPGETGGGFSDRLWSMYLNETQDQDKEMVERWKGEADSALIFVCASPTIRISHSKAHA